MLLSLRPQKFAATHALNNMSSSYKSKPFSKASSSESLTEDIVINGIFVASADDFKSSIKESTKNTEIYTLSERLKNIEQIVPLPTLKPSNLHHWFESVQRLMTLTDTSAVFLPTPPRNKALMLWSSWWTVKLKDSAPHIKIAPRDSARTILTTISNVSLASRQTNLMTITHRFWSFEPRKNMSVQDFMKEYQRRFQDLKEHTSITADVEY